MNFKKAQIDQLVEMLRTCPFLLSVHLSDNSITKDINHFYRCAEAFGIGIDDLNQVNRLPKKDGGINPNKPPPKGAQGSIDY